MLTHTIHLYATLKNIHAYITVYTHLSKRTQTNT